MNGQHGLNTIGPGIFYSGTASLQGHEADFEDPSFLVLTPVLGKSTFRCWVVDDQQVRNIDGHFQEGGLNSEYPKAP
jgi:hypothetical protein